eukprot:9127423-Karenia_brevis.AAC.1
MEEVTHMARWVAAEHATPGQFYAYWSKPELMECKELGLFTATPCSLSPTFEKSRCYKHDISSPPSDSGPEQSEVLNGHLREKILRQCCLRESYQVKLACPPWHGGSDPYGSMGGG